jgi:purine nucleoside phosphorylase
MTRIAIIGGTGSAALVPAEARALPLRETRWGNPSGSLMTWQRGSTEVFYLPRHGERGAIAPHRVNSRANIQVFRDLGCDRVIGINAVGGIVPAAWPGRIVVPDQLIDYTVGREHTFFDGTDQTLQHVEFDPPFTEAIRRGLIAAAATAGVDVLDRGTYGTTQGPRLETAAEIDRLAADGCHIVGMTAMPEAGLAREARLAYAICAVVVNRAAGRLPPGGSIHADLREHVAQGMSQVAQVLAQFLAAA